MKWLNKITDNYYRINIFISGREPIKNEYFPVMMYYMLTQCKGSGGSIFFFNLRYTIYILRSLYKICSKIYM